MPHTYTAHATHLNIHACHTPKRYMHATHKEKWLLWVGQQRAALVSPGVGKCTQCTCLAALPSAWSLRYRACATW